MAEEQGATAPEVTESTEQTLDDVYKQYGVEDQVKEFRQQPVQQPQPQQTVTPDIPSPLDEERWRAYEMQKLNGLTGLQQSLQQIATNFTQFQVEQQRSKLEADIKSAVGKVNEEVNHSNPKVIEFYLHAKADEDPRFKAIWDNRQKNPKALDAALKAVAREIAGDFEMKVDPQLAENQRARKISQQQMATTKAEEPDERWGKLSESEFDSEWQNLVHGGY